MVLSCGYLMYELLMPAVTFFRYVVVCRQNARLMHTAAA